VAGFLVLWSTGLRSTSSSSAITARRLRRARRTAMDKALFVVCVTAIASLGRASRPSPVSLWPSS
jgi:hypothetical protein